MGKRVEYKNGFVGFASDKVADILAKRGQVKILGDAKTPEPKAAKPARNRDAMVKEAIKNGLGTKEELLKLSDSEIADLVGSE
jgi:hypothetical protein